MLRCQALGIKELELLFRFKIFAPTLSEDGFSLLSPPVQLAAGVSSAVTEFGGKLSTTKRQKEAENHSVALIHPYFTPHEV